MSSVLHQGRRLLQVFTTLFWLLALTLTHLPPAEVPKTRFGDKFAHFTVYAVLCMLLYLCLWTSKRSIWKTAAIVLAIGCIYGAVDELTQPFVGRTCSLNDWYADAGGTLTVVTLFTVVRLIRPTRHN